MFSLALPSIIAAQGRGGGGGGRGQAVPRPTVVLRGHVFIGGYFYDPVHGPYPWWPRPAYPYRYFPVYDYRAEIRILATPREAAVYVDGFYAGIVDDFDGFFQRLPLPPGEHEIVLYLPGYRTARHRIYLGPGSSLKLHEALVTLPEGAKSELPRMAPPVPPPPPGSFRAPRTPPPMPPPPPPAPGRTSEAAGFGTLNLRVLPTGAEVTLDGEAWVSSDGQRFVIEVPAGTHRVEVFLKGYQRFSTEIQIHDGETTPLNVSLAKGHPIPRS
jgi:hypothetical protein